ncbi:hypothetical protein LINBF2_15420 [Limnohabitans sp. INBF002]|nr:hypothetical protein LINBF2_15420 [Limnohabitans sp. INBF002]
MLFKRNHGYTEVKMRSEKAKAIDVSSVHDKVDVQAFDTLYFMNLGLLKRINLISNGRESTIDVIFDGDWVGFDGIPIGCYSCTAISLGSGRAWSIRYDDLLRASGYEPALIQGALTDFSQQLLRRRHSPVSVKALSNDGRVADFLLQWGQSLVAQGREAGPFTMRMTRADLGLLMGLDLEAINRALSNLAFHGAIEFEGEDRSDICVPSLTGLKGFIQSDITFSRVVWQ